MKFIKYNDIRWRKVNYLRRGESFAYDYQIYLNDPLAMWDVYDYWERKRVESMARELTTKDVLFDVGTEQGWCNLVYAKMVGPSNMVLIEPTPEFWGNIRALWEYNFPNEKPLACYDGLMSNKTTDERTTFDDFPVEQGTDIIDANKYMYIHEHSDGVKEITLDDFVERTGIKPTAITIDTEGSELLVLKGAEQTLKDNDIKLWVSIHDDLASRDYKVLGGQTQTYLKSLGYKGEWLDTDHEAHWYFRK